MLFRSGELNDGYITEVEEYITEEGLNKSSAKLFPKGTLLIAMYGATVGRLGILKIKTTTNQAICGILNDKKEFEKRYMKLVSLLNSEEIESNLVLYTKKENKPFKLYKNSNNSIFIKKYPNKYMKFIIKMIYIINVYELHKNSKRKNDFYAEF